MDEYKNLDDIVSVLQNIKVSHPLDSDRYLISECISAIVDIPAADVKKNTYGKWLSCPDGAVYCSECGNYPVDDYAMTQFCPHCGIKMRNGGDVR